MRFFLATLMKTNVRSLLVVPISINTVSRVIKSRGVEFSGKVRTLPLKSGITFTSPFGD